MSRDSRYLRDLGHWALNAMDADRCRKIADRMDKMESLLDECLGDYGHPHFTDRHGMADRIRRVLDDLRESEPS